MPHRFCMVLLHLAEEARRDFDALPGKPVRSIHAIRTRMKNLRAILLLVKERVPRTSRKAIMVAAKSLKDAFSKQRDAHVVANLRAKIGGRRHAASRGEVAGRKATLNKALPVEVARLIRLVGGLRLDGLVWGDVLDAYERCYREGRSAMKACLRDSDPKLFHQWRRPVKDLFYQSRVLQPLKGMKRRARLAQRLGDRLGRWNDLRLLADRVKDIERPGVIKRIARKRKALKPVILNVAAKLYPEKPRELTKQLERCVKMLPAIAALCARQA